MFAPAELQKFEEFIVGKNLKNSQPRREVVAVFLRLETHVTLEEIYGEVRKKSPHVGFATVYRTMKLLSEAGLCRELKFEDGTTRYEHLHGHPHHDHLICTQCGKLVEVYDPEIERLQEKIFKQHGFDPQRHRMELYGICPQCKRK